MLSVSRRTFGLVELCHTYLQLDTVRDSMLDVTLDNFPIYIESETAVREAMDVIMEETCIQYRPKEADDENWMQIGEESPGFVVPSYA